MKILTDIAKTELNITTLELRKSDALDFHELSVGQIKRALEKAYKAGQSDKNKGTK